MGPKQSLYQKYQGVILGGTAVVAAIAVWEAIWYAELITPLFFSGPSAIVRGFYEGMTTGTLLEDIAYSGTNFAIGLALAITAGVILGVIVGWYEKIRMLLDPFLNALYATPRVAMMPLIIMWFGTEMKSKVFIVFISAFFPILVNTVAGVRTLDRDLLRAARSFCASDWQVFKTVAIPGSVPFILTGVRQGVALGLIGVVVGEMFGGSRGVGFLIVYGGQTFQTDTVFVGVVLVAFSGMLLTWLAERLERRFSRWRPDR